MADCSTHSLPCRKCGQNTQVPYYDSINVKDRPDLKARVLDGSLFVWQCPYCGTANLMQGQTLYHDPENRVMVWVTGGDRALEEQACAAYGRIDALDGYVLRFVDEVGGLVEKIKILDAGLDDVVMEMAKYVTKMELCQKDHEVQESIMAAPFKFLSMAGADNEITLAYPLDGQMQMVAIGFNVYEDCRGIIKRNPDVAAAASGFCKVDSAFLAQFFR